MRKHGRKAIVFSLLAVLLAIAGWLNFQHAERADLKPLTETPTQKPILINSTPTAAQRKTAEDALYRMPISFELNAGQSPSIVKYQSRGHGYALFLGEGAALMMLKSHSVREGKPARPNDRGFDIATLHDSEGTMTFLKLKFCNSNLNANIHGINEVVARSNYFKGSKSNWVTDIPNYSKVCYDDIYPGIDMVYYGNEGVLEYDYIVRPGADPSAIAMEFENAQNMKLNDKGDLLIEMEGGTICKSKPVVYQEVDGQRRRIEGAYAVLSPNKVGIKLGDYDRSKSLVIDPSVIWATLIGDATPAVATNNKGDDIAFGIAIDPAGNAVLTGSTDSYDFPQLAPLGYSTLNDLVMPSNSGFTTDAFILSFSPDGKTLNFSSWFGGAQSDGGMAVALDTQGNIYFTGFAGDGIFPLVNPRFFFTGGSSDAFVTKLAPGGKSIIYSTMIGGTGADIGLGIAADAQGNAYVTGLTQSNNFPKRNALISSFTGTTAGFAAKFSPDGSNVIFSTYIDGPGTATQCNSIAVDASANIYIGGQTNGLNPLLIKNAFQSVYKGGAGSNGFLLKLDTNAAITIFGTYLGDTGPDGVTSIGVDRLSRVFVTGFTNSANFPTVSPNQGIIGGGQDAFLTIFDNSGQTISYSTFIGGSAMDVGNSIFVDPDGYAYITGTTASIDFPVNPGGSPPIQAGNAGANDAFVAKYNPTGGQIYATYLGATLNDAGNGVAAGAKGTPFEGNLYVTGKTEGSGAPGTFGTFRGGVPGATNPGAPDVFVARIGDLSPRITSPNTIVAAVGQAITPYTITATNSPKSFGAAGLSGPNLTIGGPNGNVITGIPNASGTFQVLLTASNDAGTGTLYLTVVVNGSAPIINGPFVATGNQAQGFTYNITASQNPTSFNATNLPPGLTIDTLTGIISGTPTLGGSFTATISATNNLGTGTASLTINIVPQPPIIVSSLTANGTVGAPFNYLITALNNPTGFTASPLPAGLSVSSTGVISGIPTTPTLPGPAFSVTLTATNTGGTSAPQTLKITIDTKPVINSALTASGVVNSPFSYTITALNGPIASFSATGLPAGLSIAGPTISGSPTSAGVFIISLSATNASGTGQAILTLNISQGPPVINSPTTASFPVNSPFLYTITATNTPTSFTATGLPAGLTLDATTGIISGTVSTLGSFTITVGASNAAGTAPGVTVTINIVAAPPNITSPTTANGNVNLQFQYQITASGSTPITFTAAPLPPGLTLSSTGLISGIPTQKGTFSVALTATNSLGTDNKTLIITIGISTNVITEPDSDSDLFLDPVEVAMGTDPADPTSHPGTSKAVLAGSLSVMPTISLDFSSSTSTKDGISLKGTFSVPRGTILTSNNSIVFVGGVTRSFGAGGTSAAAPGPKDKFTVKVGKKPDVGNNSQTSSKSSLSTNVLATFTLKLSGNFKTALANSGLTGNQTIKNAVARTVDIVFYFIDNASFGKSDGTPGGVETVRFQSGKVVQYKGVVKKKFTASAKQ